MLTAETRCSRPRQQDAGSFGVHLNNPGKPKPYAAQLRRGGKQYLSTGSIYLSSIYLRAEILPITTLVPRPWWRGIVLMSEPYTTITVRRPVTVGLTSSSGRSVS